MVELGAWHHGAAAIGLVGQAHFFELAVDLFKQGLVTRNGLGIASMAAHPAHNLGAVFKQLVGHVGVDQAGQAHVFGFEDVEVVTQFASQLFAPVAGLHLHLQPTRAGVEALCGRINGECGTRALEPTAIAAAHDVVGGDVHAARGGQFVGGRDQRPATGVGVVLFVEHQVQVGVAARRQLVGCARDTFAVVGAHQLHDGAGGQANRHVFEFQGHIVVGLDNV